MLSWTGLLHSPKPHKGPLGGKREARAKHTQRSIARCWQGPAKHTLNAMCLQACANLFRMFDTPPAGHAWPMETGGSVHPATNSAAPCPSHSRYASRRPQHGPSGLILKAIPHARSTVKGSQRLRNVNGVTATRPHALSARSRPRVDVFVAAPGA